MTDPPVVAPPVLVPPGVPASTGFRPLSDAVVPMEQQIAARQVLAQQEAERQLAALQLADGLFPAGGFASSNGLEQLARDRDHQPGPVPALRVPGFLAAELHGRFGPFDRVAVVAAHRRHDDWPALAGLDAAIERLTWASVQRRASVEAGRGLLTAAARLPLPGAAAVLAAVRAGDLLGHQPLALGLVLRGVGLDEAAAQRVAGHRFLSGLAQAAVRLGLVGAIGAQAALLALRPALADWSRRPVPEPYRLTAFSPRADIAMMRHRTADARLFAT